MHQLILSRLAALGLICLAGCAPQGLTTDRAYRDQSVPIFSNAAFQPGRLMGTWQQVAGFSGGERAECAAGSVVFSQGANAVLVDYDLCLGGQPIKGSGRLEPTGPGRFAIRGKDRIGQDWWALWVDEGYRTMAIGSPSGDFGFVLNRGRGAAQDRLDAAREVMDFNGYDVDLLTFFR